MPNILYYEFIPLIFDYDVLFILFNINVFILLLLIAQDRCHRIGQSKPVVVYRLLTPGSVEIEMMERQISKKKLERLAVYGGDFRQAGKRAGSELTLSNIRKLLEDDVKNLSRMSSSTASGSGSGGVQSVLNDTKKEDISQYTEISQHELSMLMNRDLLFVKTIQSSDAASRVPTPTSVAATIHESALSPKPNKLDSASIDAKLLSSDTKKKSVTKVVKSSPSKTQSTPSDMQTTDIKTTTASATDGGGGTALDALGNEEHRLITYEVNEKVPIEGAMYDIICIDPNQISGMLQGFNV